VGRSDQIARSRHCAFAGEDRVIASRAGMRRDARSPGCGQADRRERAALQDGSANVAGTLWLVFVFGSGAAAGKGCGMRVTWSILLAIVSISTGMSGLVAAREAEPAWWSLALLDRDRTLWLATGDGRQRQPVANDLAVSRVLWSPEGGRLALAGVQDGTPVIGIVTTGAEPTTRIVGRGSEASGRAMAVAGLARWGIGRHRDPRGECGSFRFSGGEDARLVSGRAMARVPAIDR
jgi:hypothetical protein